MAHALATLEDGYAALYTTAKDTELLRGCHELRVSKTEENLSNPCGGEFQRERILKQANLTFTFVTNVNNSATEESFKTWIIKKGPHFSAVNLKLENVLCLMIPNENKPRFHQN